jgi:biopolymer transport protein ExbB/TolQ
MKSKNQKNILTSFEDDIKRGRLDKVIDRSRILSEHESIAAVVQAGAQAALSFGGKDEIQSKMDEVLSVENVKLERRTGFLSMLANVSTLLGLLGTIVGLIQSFASIANMNGVEKSTTLTQGVALAMNATAYGLIVAIPTLILYGVLVNRTNHLQEDLNQSAFKAFNWLSFNYESTSRKINQPTRSAN